MTLYKKVRLKIGYGVQALLLSLQLLLQLQFVNFNVSVQINSLG